MSPHGGNLWALTDIQGVSPLEILDFSADLNPFGPPPGLAEMLERIWPRLRWYPDPSYSDFCRAAGELHGLAPQCILPGNGTAELIHLIARFPAFDQGTVVVPTFTEYERALRIAGKKVIHRALGTDGDFERGLVFLCNPNNPTGTLWPKKELVGLMEGAAPRGVTVVVDEAYMDLVEDGLRYSLAAEVERFDNLIVLRSLTKSFTLPGLRVGYLTASPSWVRGLAEQQPPWSMNALAAVLGPWLLRQHSFLSESRRKLSALRESLGQGLRALPGLQVCPSFANFFLCEQIGAGPTAGELSEALKERGILIRLCDDFVGLEAGRFFRVAIGRQQENDRLLAALKEILLSAV